MKRTTIFLPEALERDIQGEARRAGKPMASVVREALAEYVAARRVDGPPLSFVACASGTRRDVAARHEELLWKEPHGTRGPRTATRRRKAR